MQPTITRYYGCYFNIMHLLFKKVPSCEEQKHLIFQMLVIWENENSLNINIFPLHFALNHWELKHSSYAHEMFVQL